MNNGDIDRHFYYYFGKMMAYAVRKHFFDISPLIIDNQCKEVDMMKNRIDVEKLFSTNLRNVYICLTDGPCTPGEIVSKASKFGISFPHPAEDVRKSLSILEIMGIVNKKISGSSRFFELSDCILVDPANIYNISRGIGKTLDELDSMWTEKSVETIKERLKDISDEDFRQILDLLKKKNRIRIENGKMIKNVTVYTYKKTSD